MAIIIGIVIILFLVLLAWSWHNLGTIEKTSKIIYIIIGFMILYIFTFIIYNVSKSGIQYENKDIMNTIRTVLVILFAIMNGLIILPYTFKIIEQININQLTKEDFKKNIIILIINIIVIFIFEINYLKNSQIRILNMLK